MAYTKQEQKAYHKANKEKIAEQKKKHYQANKEKILKRKKAYVKANKEKIADRNKAYRKANKEKIAEHKKKHYQANKEKIIEREKAYRKANKEKILKQKKGYEKQRYKSDPLYKLKRIYRNSCGRAFNSIGKKKNNKSLKLLGLKTWQQLAKHLSKQFYDHPETGKEMTLDDHGLYGWHIDHIIPLDTAKTEEDIIKLCHYTNLQPLWAKHNLRKGNKILDTQSII